METNEKDKDAHALSQYRADFERNVETIVREFEANHKGPLEVDLSFIEGEGSGPAPEELRPRVQSVVDAFHRKPLVQQSGVRVHKVTAIDSDEDGQIAVRVMYDYPDYPDEKY